MFCLGDTLSFARERGTPAKSLIAKTNGRMGDLITISFTD